jgi:CubicO group peptidase (beta-lactamase class C family)
MDALDLVAGWPVEVAAVGVTAIAPPGVRPSRGPVGPLGPVEPLGSVGPSGQVFPWASVTKPATALATLVAVEEGSLSLEDPAGPDGSTVRHLLAHASGLGPGPGPPLARPGVRRIYSNAGYGVLADLVAARTGIPFADYLRLAVLEPLGMTGTVLRADAPAPAAAAGLAGPLDDLLRLGGELATPTLISPGTHRVAVRSQFPALAGVLPGFGRCDPCDWGLGVEIRGTKHPHWTGTANARTTFGHFGQSGSFLWIDPEAGVLCAGLGDRPFGSWAARSWPVLADAVLAEVRRAGRWSADRDEPPDLRDDRPVPR